MGVRGGERAPLTHADGYPKTGRGGRNRLDERSDRTHKAFQLIQYS